MIEVLAAGPLATVQDLGRLGHAAFGVPRSGAFDRAAARAANRLVGNPENAGVLEITLGGLALRLGAAATIALTGAACPGLDGGRARSLAAGAVIRLGMPTSGLRSYLAVRGGIVVDPVLGSRSTDVLSGLGPRPVRAGDLLPVGRPVGTAQPSDAVIPGADLPSIASLAVQIGPRADWFTASAVEVLTGSVWTVRPDSDRVGIRLAGRALPRRRHDELPSEPTLPGAIQVPPDGRPILLGPDAPVTGGYPVIAVAYERSLDLAAQLRPGAALRFAPVADTTPLP